MPIVFNHNKASTENVTSTTTQCNCTSTTTVTYTCIPKAIKLCEDLCNNKFLNLNCILYSGPDNSCYGVQNGQTVKEIIEKIINRLEEQNC